MAGCPLHPDCALHDLRVHIEIVVCDAVLASDELQERWAGHMGEAAKDIAKQGLRDRALARSAEALREGGK